MTTGTKLITAEELWALPNNARRELVRGEVRTMAPAGFEHGAVIMNIAVPLGVYVKARQLGVVLGAETGFVLRRNPDIVRGADVAFVERSRIPTTGLPIKFWEGSPDLVVEVVSPGDTVEEVEEKVDDYLSAGTRMVWVANPKRKTVTVHRPGAQPTVLRLDDFIDGGDVVPDFRLAVVDVFA
jgi:Uma2 family endonuclease